VEYIRNLETESERLKKLVKDINAQLHASKVSSFPSFFTFQSSDSLHISYAHFFVSIQVAQNALTRKFGRGYDSNEENDGVF